MSNETKPDERPYQPARVLDNGFLQLDLRPAHATRAMQELRAWINRATSRCAEGATLAGGLGVSPKRISLLL